ncbi:MAG: hypothetical protein MJE77_25555 [Proteobacteria bacterium]|nr:hypothetical protein [Pseudomonadota bacterium]
MITESRCYSYVALQPGRVLYVGLVTLVLALYGGGDASASPDGQGARKPGQKSAQTTHVEAFALGNKLFEERKWAEARAEYLKALKLQFDPLLLFNIGSTYRREGNYIEALFYYHRYLDEAPRNAPYRTVAQRVVMELNVKLEAQKKATERERKKKKKKKKKKRQRPKKDNDNETDFGRRGDVGATTGPDQPNRAMRITGVTLMVLGVVGLGWGGYEGHRSLQITSELNDLDPGAEWTAELQAKHDRGKTAQTRSQVLLTAGSLAAVAGAAMFLLSKRNSVTDSSTGAANSSTKSSFAISPVAAGGELGLTLHLEF